MILAWLSDVRSFGLTDRWKDRSDCGLTVGLVPQSNSCTTVLKPAEILSGVRHASCTQCRRGYCNLFPIILEPVLHLPLIPVHANVRIGTASRVWQGTLTSTPRQGTMHAHTVSPKRFGNEPKAVCRSAQAS
jgi:hypothetical protein